MPKTVEFKPNPREQLHYALMALEVGELHEAVDRLILAINMGATPEDWKAICDGASPWVMP